MKSSELDSAITTAYVMDVKTQHDALGYVLAGKLRVYTTLDRLNNADSLTGTSAVAGALGTAVGSAFKADPDFITGAAFFGSTALVLNQTLSLREQRTILENASTALNCTEKQARNDFLIVSKVDFVANRQAIEDAVKALEIQRGKVAQTLAELAEPVNGASDKVAKVDSDIVKAREYLFWLDSAQTAGAIAVKAKVDEILQATQQELDDRRATAQSLYAVGSAAGGLAAAQKPQVAPQNPPPAGGGAPNATTAASPIQKALDDMAEADKALADALASSPDMKNYSPSSVTLFNFSACMLPSDAIPPLTFSPDTIALEKGKPFNLFVSGGKGLYTAAAAGTVDTGVVTYDHPENGHFVLTLKADKLTPFWLQISNSDGTQAIHVQVTQKAAP